MKAVVVTKYGPPDVLQLREVPKPNPKDDEVLVRIRATTVARGDCELRSLELPIMLRLMMRIGFGFRGPRRKILGQELAGEIESTGKDVTLFSKGDQVFALTGLHLGAYAEYDCLPESGLIAVKPANMSFEEAAAVPVGGLHAFYFLSRSNIQIGQKVLIIGAGGSIGTFAVQIAKSFGAEVTGVDGTGKLDALRSIGADHVIDYTRQDFSEDGQIYDVIFDAVGKGSFARCLRSLSENGLYLLGNPGLSQRVRARWISMTSNRKTVSGMSSYKPGDLVRLRELIESGKIRSVIDRRYPLEQVVDAHRYVDTGQKTGNVIMTV
jgi:NADPH:quinone reductase-like Zn-dependent oxidoreductase